MKSHSLTLMERMVIESLSRGERALSTIVDDTGLPENVVYHSLRSLMADSIAQTFNGNYALSESFLKGAKHCDIEGEVKEIAEGLIKHHFNGRPNIALKKVWLGKEDEKIFDALLRNVDDFLKSVSTPKQGRTQDQRVIFWGAANYLETARALMA